ncbi:MAG: TonB family protein [Myxococcota bacterium]
MWHLFAIAPSVVAAPASIEEPYATAEVPAVYPPEARAQGLEAEVAVTVQLDATGAVIHVEVAQPAGHGFDEAAMAAARSTTFSPAFRDGVPIASEFVVIYGFDLPPIDGEQRFAGRVFRRGSVAPVANATVDLRFEGSVRRTTSTRPDGRFDIADLAAGTYELVINHPHHQTFTFSIDVPAEEPLDIVLQSDDDASTVAFGTYRAPSPDEQPLSGRIVRRIPGTFGDPVRVLETLPGVAAAPVYDAFPTVRGGEPTHTRLTIDGIDIPFLFHFFVGRSVVNPALVDRIRFVPGALPVDVSQTAQALADVQTAPRRETRGWHGRLGLDVLDANVALWHTGPQVEITLAARGSVPGVVVTTASSASSSLGLFPNYGDYFGRVGWQHNQHAVTVSAFGAADSLRQPNLDATFAFVPPEELPFDPDQTFARSFHRLATHWTTNGRWGEQRTFVAAGLQRESSTSGNPFLPELEGVRAGRYRGRVAQFGNETSLGKGHSTRFDLGMHGDLLDLDVLSFRTLEEALLPPERVRAWWVSPYASVGPRLGRLNIELGARGSVHGLPSGTAFVAEPRAVIRFAWSDRVTASAFVGQSAQRPALLRLVSVAGGNTDLPVVRTQSTGLGLVAETGDVRVEGHAWIARMPSVVVRQVSYELRRDRPFDPFLSLQPVPAFQAASGGAVGGDLQLRIDRRRWFGLASVAVASTWRELSETRFRSDRDQPLGLTMAAGGDLGRRWRVSGRLRFATGRPYTVPAPVYSAVTDTFSALPGPRNGARLPALGQLDARVEKAWERRRVTWTAYLDVYNVLNVRQPLLVEFTPSFDERITRVWLPALPNLGFDVTF